MASQARTWPGASLVLGLSPHRFWGAPVKPVLATMACEDADTRVADHIETVLAQLRFAGRKSVEIVDLACGDGRTLIAAALRARALGFVAIEVKGFDEDPDQVEAAWARAMNNRDLRIGYSFMVAPDDRPIPIEDHDADIVIGDGDEPELHRIAAHEPAIVIRAGSQELH